MKILITTDCYIFQTGGVANVVLALEDSLRELGHEVRVLALSDNGQSRVVGESCYIRSFPVFFYPEQRRSFALRDSLLEELKAWKPDLIHIHTEASTALMAHAIARETGAPIVMTTHTDFAYFIFGRGGYAPGLKQCFALWGKCAYKRARVVIVPSEKAISIPQVAWVKDRIKVVPSGIRLERYQKPVTPGERGALLRQSGLTDNGYTLVMVTRVSREKNIAEILHYFPALLRALPQAQLLIAGDGPELRRLKKTAAEKGLSGHICFTGRIDPDEVYRYYASGDAFVSASTFETQGLTYLEALARGLPLICRDDPVLRNVLEEGKNGYRYRCEEEFVARTVRILEDRSLREAMRINALAKAEEYSAERFGERMAALYEGVIRENGKDMKGRHP